MLIRVATERDKNHWISLAEDVEDAFNAPGMANDQEFHDYIESKLSKNEAIIAVDRMTDACLGMIGFSRTHNRITWFGVFEKYRGRGIGEELLKCALNQLDWGKEITVVTYIDGYTPGIPAKELYKKFGFLETANSEPDKYNNPRCKMAIAGSDRKQGWSFHYKYDTYAKWAEDTGCPVCQKQKSPNPPVIIKEFEHSWLECHEEAQGRLFGKCHVLSKKHSEHFYDMAKEDMADFMADVQKAAEALHKVTGAVKINYEIHGNSLPHLHAHLYPRYLNDDFPSAPIDYRVMEPSPYETHGEFLWFVDRMRELL